MSTHTPETIDRIAPTLRPPGGAVMHQTWSDLLFLHWRLPLAAVRPLVPSRLDVDTFEDHAWVGLIPFTVSGARLRWLPPVPLLSSFHEVNVRTYVHYQGRDPGVWFFSLDASSQVAVEVARRWYKLPYRFAQIGFQVEEAQGPPLSTPRRIGFVSRRVSGDPPELDVRYGAGDFPRPAAPGTLEHFLVERYILYAQGEDGLYQARVHHAAYPLQAGVVEHLRERLVAAAGLQRPESDPLMHYASGVEVEVFSPRRLA